VREDPVLIIGAPRSGTSVTAAILQRCGLWLGETGRGNRDNPKGFFENKRIRQKNKAVLHAGGYDAAGVQPLPPWNWIGNTAHLRETVLIELGFQGVKPDQPWGFKDPKLLLTWATWLSAWPKARIVLVRRDRESVVRSCARASFYSGWARRGMEWNAWVADQERRIELIKRTSPYVAELWPGRLALADGWHAFRDAVEALGLEWKLGAQDTFDAEIWNR